MPKTKIHVANEPFLARSAIQTFLRNDSRFDAVLVPASAHSVDGSEGDVVIVSGATRCEGSVIVRLFETHVEIIAGSTRMHLPYAGLRWLVDLIAAITARSDGRFPTPNAGRKRPEHDSRDGPAKEGSNHDP